MLFWNLYSVNNPEKMYHGSLKNIKHINVSQAVNQYIRMISEWSCDTEDWSNDAECSFASHE